MLSRRHLFMSLSAVLALGLGGIGLRSTNGRYYSGPISDHFDGERFFDPHGAPPKSLLDLMRWWSSNGKAEWPDWSPSPFSDRPPPRVDGSRCRLSFVGHASFLLQTAGLNILIDPIWSARASPVGFAGPKRVNDPGIAWDALPPVDVVVVSHGHYDHLDLDTLSRLHAAFRPRLVTALGQDAIIREHDAAVAAQAYDWGERIDLAPGIAVTLIPVRHWSARTLFDRNTALWAGFVIETPAGKILHIPDSGYGDGWHFRNARDKYGPFRLAALPIGAYEPRWFMREQHMNPHEAVQAFLDCGAEHAVGHHHGTFQLTDEPIDAPLHSLAEALADAGLEPARFRALKPGEVLDL